MLQNLFQNVIEVTLTTSAVIAVLLLLLPFIHKKYTVKWWCWVWLVLAVRLLIPFSLSLPQAPIEIAPPLQNLELKVPVQNTMTPPLINNMAVTQVPKDLTAARTITLNEVLSIIWALGIGIFMFYHLFGYFLFRKFVLRFSRPVEDKRIIKLWCEIKDEMNIGENVQLLSCKKLQSPMMTGFFKPVLLLPDLSYPDNDLKIILRHELIHYKRKDIWYKLLFVCANAAHWFNPLIYFMVAMSNKDIEMVCDSEMIRDSDTVFRKQYSETILSAIHKGNIRQTAFSTYFYGGKNTMKERLTNIFDMSKKRKGIITLCIIIIGVGAVGASVAYSTNDNRKLGIINNIDVFNFGNTYYLSNGKFIISYGDAKSAVVPLEPITDDLTLYFEDKAVYISDEVTAVAYSENTNNADTISPVAVLISNDKGQTWNSYPVADAETVNYSQKYIGFITKNDGWLLLTGGVAMGSQKNRIFATSDGGKTWNEIGNTNDVYQRVVTGAGFANKNIGFVSFRYDIDPNPIVYRTKNKGKTWARCLLEIPDSFKSITRYATALSPIFNGANGILPVMFRMNGIGEEDLVDVQVQYATSDYGETWTFNEKYNLALIWAEAWKTRNGKMRYEIMSDKMKEDFLEQQKEANGSVWKTVDTGSYTVSVPNEWDLDVFSESSVNFAKHGNKLGSLEVLGYNSSLPISQFEGNYAETFNIKALEGCKYPATEVMIRRTQPAGANDDSYVDELHIYLIPENGNIAYDLFFDSFEVDETTAVEIAKTFIPSSWSKQQSIQNIKNYFYERVNYNPDEDLLSFTIPETIPENYKFYLHVCGRMFMGDSSDGMSFHRFDDESESFGWIKGKTYTCSVESENLDECILDFGLIDKDDREFLSTIHIYSDGTKKIDSVDL